jgi:hypothetical protein
MCTAVPPVIAMLADEGECKLVNDPMPNWPNSLEPQHRTPPPTNRAHDDSPCVNTSTTPQGPSGDGLTEGLRVAVGLGDAVNVDVEVAVGVRVAVDVTVIDTEELEEGVTAGVRVGVLDCVLEDVM